MHFAVTSFLILPNAILLGVGQSVFRASTTSNDSNNGSNIESGSGDAFSFGTPTASLSSPILVTSRRSRTLISGSAAQARLLTKQSLSASSLQEKSVNCNDGSEYVFYSSILGSQNWIVYLEGGSACNDNSSCTQRAKNYLHLTSSRGLPTTLRGKDLLSPMASENPAFFDYNHVLLPYCTSDFWLGEQRNSSDSSNLTFTGALAFRAAVRSLLEQGMITAEKVVLAGTDAGGVGAVHHAKWLRSLLTSKSARVSVLCDSCMLVDFNDAISQEFGFGRSSLMTQATNVASCKKFWHGLPCCFSVRCVLQTSPSEVLDNGKIPLFLIVSAFDLFGLRSSLDAVLRSDFPGQQELIDTVDSYRGWSDQELSIVTEDNSVSVFDVGCSQHGYLTASTPLGVNSSKAQRISVSSPPGAIFFRLSQQTRPGYWLSIYGSQGSGWENRSLAIAVASWARDGVRVAVRTTCHGLRCHSTCPEYLSVEPVMGVATLLGIPPMASLTIAVASCLAVFLSMCVLVVSSMVIRMTANKARQEINDDELSGVPDCKKEDALAITCHLMSFSVEDPFSNLGIFNQTNKVSPAPPNRVTEETVPLRSSEGDGRVLEGAESPRSTRRKTILNNVNVEFEPSWLVAIMGPSGCGKSTFLNILSGRKMPTKVRLWLLWQS